MSSFLPSSSSGQGNSANPLTRSTVHNAAADALKKKMQQLRDELEQVKDDLERSRKELEKERRGRELVSQRKTKSFIKIFSPSLFYSNSGRVRS